MREQESVEWKRSCARNSHFHFEILQAQVSVILLIFRVRAIHTYIHIEDVIRHYLM